MAYLVQCHNTEECTKKTDHQKVNSGNLFQESAAQHFLRAEMILTVKPFKEQNEEDVEEHDVSK